MKSVDVQRWKRYFAARDLGLGVGPSARKARIDESTAYRFERNDPSSSGLEAAAVLGVTMVAGMIVAAPLSTEAQTALDDFAYYRYRYFGRRSTPWQERAAYEVLRAISTPDREYIVMNEPPGSGKSTLFTNDIPCWLITRDRGIRIQIGSRTEGQAHLYVRRIKRSLEREAPLRATSDDFHKGIAWDATAALIDDYGAFKPEGRADKWRNDGLVVRQLDGVSLDDKEDTVSGWGMDSGFLGGRYDLVVWDDLVDKKNMRTLESRQQLEDSWATEFEPRLEPGGVLLLQGQRIQNNDLYKYCLNATKPNGEPKYRHVVYKAHYPELCPGDGTHSPEPWPVGCLLDPHRLPYEHLETIKHNTPRVFAISYQQEDTDGAETLIDPAWITGDVDYDGYPAPGCLDRDRGIYDPPEHLPDRDHFSFVTVDPSPDEWWGVIWWLYDPETDNRYIIDIARRKMAPDIWLGEDIDTYQFSGIHIDWTETGNDLGIPITHVIVETNAAQKWLLSQKEVQRWMRATGQAFLPHTTHINKQDPKYGFRSIGSLFKQGKVRIPWGDIASRTRMQPLIDEGTLFPDYDTDDLLMSTWFGKLAVENFYVPRNFRGYHQERPAWMSQAQRGMAGYAYSR